MLNPGSKLKNTDFGLLIKGSIKTLESKINATVNSPKTNLLMQKEINDRAHMIRETRLDYLLQRIFTDEMESKSNKRDEESELTKLAHRIFEQNYKTILKY